MAIRQYDLSIDIKREIYERIKLKPQDTGNKLKVRLSEDGAPKDLTGNTVRFCAKKADGKGVYTVAQKVDEKNGVVIIDIDNNATAVTGLITCEIEIEQEDVFITTFSFYIEVVEKINDGKFIESTNEFAELILAMKATKKATEDCIAKTADMENNINEAIEHMKSETTEATATMLVKVGGAIRESQENSKRLTAKLHSDTTEMQVKLSSTFEEYKDKLQAEHDKEGKQITALIVEHETSKQHIESELEKALRMIDKTIFEKVQNEHLMKLEIDVAILKNATLRDMTYNVFFERLDTLDDIEIIEGVFDETQRRFIL